MKLLEALLAVSERLVDRDEAAEALADRWRRLAEPGRVEARLMLCRGAVEDADVLIGLAEAAVGRGAVEAFSRRLCRLLDDPAFEQEVRFCPDPPVVSLGRLAGLAGRLRALDLPPAIGDEAAHRLRRLAATLMADVKPTQRQADARAG